LHHPARYCIISIFSKFNQVSTSVSFFFSRNLNFIIAVMRMKSQLN